MRIGAIFLYYGRWDWARETLEMLLGGSRAPDHVVVVDNGSGDGSADRARAAYPGLEVVELTANVGPSAGMNAGLRALSGRDDLDLVQLVPSDCRLAPDALELLAARMAEDESLGAVGPLLAWLDDPDRVWSAGGNIHPRNWDTGHTGVPGTVSEWRGRPPRE